MHASSLGHALRDGRVRVFISLCTCFCVDTVKSYKGTAFVVIYILGSLHAIESDTAVSDENSFRSK